MGNQTGKENEHGTPIVDKVLRTHNQVQRLKKLRERYYGKPLTKDEKKQVQRKQLYFKIKLVKKRIKYFASEQRELRKIDQSLHALRRGVITALLNHYNRLRGKPPHAIIPNTYAHKHSYKATQDLLTWHML